MSGGSAVSTVASGVICPATTPLRLLTSANALASRPRNCLAEEDEEAGPVRSASSFQPDELLGA
jgi:hypothetical protein